MDTPVLISEAISRGWEKMTRHLGFFVLLLLILAVIDAAITNVAKVALPHFFREIVDWSLSWLTGMAIVFAGLRVHDALPVGWDDFKRLYSSGQRVGNYILSHFLYWLIVAGGMFLLVIPGIIWGVQFSFAGFVVVDEGLGPVEALKRSSQLTRGHRTDLFLFWLALFGINLLGALALLIGLFATIPTSAIAAAWVFRRLQALAPAAGLPAGPRNPEPPSPQEPPFDPGI